MSTGAELRDTGHLQLELSMGQAGEYWAERAWAFIVSLPRGSAFTADRLREVVGTPPRVNAPGMLIRRAAKDGLLTETGYAQSERPERRAGAVKTWVRT